MLIRLLGPVDVVDDAGDVHGLTSGIRRSLLALLALHAGRVLSPDWLLEHVWNGDVPDSGRRALRFHVSQLRRELAGLDLVETCPGGYRLRAAPEETDIGTVEALGRAARQEPDSRRAAGLCQQALAMWRGEPFIDASPTSDLADEGARLGELRLSLVELAYQRQLDAGDGTELVVELVRLTGDHPLRERLWQILIAAQYRTGRQADALRSYDKVRSILVETLGIEPSPELQELHKRVLNQDPTLDPPPSRSQVFAMWDVESTTGLLVRRGQAGFDILAAVADLVAVATRGCGGRVSTSEGERDGAVMLFDSVNDAIDAAIVVNQQLAAKPWPDRELVGIRTAIHVADATATAEGVFGPEVRRCVRLRALADDGEVFLSDEAARSAARTSADEWSMADEGLVTLRGSHDCEHVWRLVHPALRSRQRALRGMAADVATLPTWRTSFIGRSRDVATIRGRLDVGRLVTLVGPAGVGKTRLAAAVAAETSRRVCFIDLSVASQDRDVDALVADGLGSRLVADPRTSIGAALRAAPTWLVLDNCEHVLDGAASLVDYLLSECDESSVLVTSRSALRLPDEDVFVVSPLPTGLDSAAVQLFIDRAVARGSEWTTDELVLAQIDAVTSLLEGVPLAIELAAAQTGAYSPREVLALLQRDLAGLGDARRRGPARHRTLRAAIESSMRMLSDAERRLLCRLATLPGSYRLSTALAATASDTREESLLIAALPVFVEQSLLSVEHRQGPTRYRMLEMIRSVAQDALDPVDRQAVLDRLLVHCLEQLNEPDRPVPPEVGFEAELTRDTALYSAAVEHSIATCQAGPGLDLAYKLFMVWRGKTQRATLDRWMTNLVELTDTPSSTRAMVLRREALIAIGDFGDEERAAQLLDAAEADAIAVNDRALLGRIRSNRADIDLAFGRFEAEVRLHEAIALLEESGDQYAAVGLETLADLYTRQAKFDQADEFLRRAKTFELPWHERINLELRHVLLALNRGHVGSATEHAATALDIAERSEEPEFIHTSVAAAAAAALARGELELARELSLRTVALAREHDLQTSAYALSVLAFVSALAGDLAVAGACRDELRSIGRGLLVCLFVDLAEGDLEAAEVGASEMLAQAEHQEDAYAHISSLELVAACVAAHDPQRARDLLDTASRERTAIRATAWPFEPFRYVALQTLEARQGDEPTTPAHTPT